MNEQVAKNQLLTVEEACRLLKVCRSTLWKLRRQGELTAVYIGNRGVRFRLADLEAFLQRKSASGIAR